VDGRKASMSRYEEAEYSQREWYAIHESGPGSIISVIQGITPLALGDKVSEEQRPAGVIIENHEPSSGPILRLEGIDGRVWYLGLSECIGVEHLEEHMDTGPETRSDD
jgi:hypothetical protein